MSDWGLFLLVILAFSISVSIERLVGPLTRLADAAQPRPIDRAVLRQALLQAKPKSDDVFDKAHTLAVEYDRIMDGRP